MNLPTKVLIVFAASAIDPFASNPYITATEIGVVIATLFFGWWLAAKLTEEWKVATKQRKEERLNTLRRAAATSYIRRVK